MAAVLKESAPTRTAWDLWIVLLVAVSCVVVPYQAAFQHQVDLAGSLIVYSIDVFFFLDIALNLRTSFRRHGVEVTERTAIAGRYLRTFFVVDVVAAVPFDALLLPWSGVGLAGVSVVLLLRLTRLLRVVRLFVIFRRWERQSWVNAGYLRIANLLAVILLLFHWVACAWFLVPYLEGFPAGSWVVAEGIQAADRGTQYVRSLYWVIVTTTTVGFGDITPHRNVEYVFTMFVMLLGASMYAFVIGNIASLVSNLDAAKAAFWNRVESVSQYLRARRVPAELNERVRSYYEYLWAVQRGAQAQSFLRDLPAPMRLDVMGHLAKELTSRVPLFLHCTPALRNVLLMGLQPEIFAPGDTIVRDGDVADGIYFLSSGTVDITSEDGKRHHGSMGEGDHFGDLSLLLGERRTASVTARTYCHVFVLDKQDFERIKRDYQELRDVLKRIADEKTEKVSDLVLEGIVL